MLRFPTTDAFVAPQKVALRSLTTYWAMGEVPPGFFALIRLLKPHERDRACKFIRRLTEWSMRFDYERAVQKGLGPEAVLKVVGHGAGKRCEAGVSFRDGGIAAAFLPVLVARRFCEGVALGTGLLSAVDLFGSGDVAREMVDDGWASSFRAHLLDDRG